MAIRLNKQFIAASWIENSVWFKFTVESNDFFPTENYLAFVTKEWYITII